MINILRFPAALAATLFLTGTAFAQQEQWLVYHTGESKGYRWMDLTNVAPAGVKLPALQSGAYYGRWTNAFEAGGGRWFCLDRTRSSGPCDRIFFDSNGNGRLDDESPVNAKRRDQNWSYFDPIKVVFKGEDGPISYHLNVRFYKYGSDRAQVMAGSGGWYEGTVTIGGKKRWIQVADNNVNGVFNDLSENSSECDFVMVGDKEGEKNRRYLGRYLEVGGQLLRLEVARDGAFIKAEKAKGVAFGAVRVPQTISEFVAFGENGHFVRQPASGDFTLPVGRYRVHSWTIQRKDAQGTAWKLTGSGLGQAAEFQVTAGPPVSLNVGEPIRAALTASETKTQVSFSLRLLGSFGESVEIHRGSERPRPPQIQLASVKGDFRATNKFEYG